MEAGGSNPKNWKEETLQLEKVDPIPKGLEIIGRWHEKKNTYTYQYMNVELAVLNKDQA